MSWEDIYSILRIVLVRQIMAREERKRAVDQRESELDLMPSEKAFAKKTQGVIPISILASSSSPPVDTAKLRAIAFKESSSKKVALKDLKTPSRGSKLNESIMDDKRLTAGGATDFLGRSQYPIPFCFSLTPLGFQRKFSKGRIGFSGNRKTKRTFKERNKIDLEFQHHNLKLKRFRSSNGPGDGVGRIPSISSLIVLAQMRHDSQSKMPEWSFSLEPASKKHQHPLWLSSYWLFLF